MDDNSELFWAVAKTDIARVSALQDQGADLNGHTELGEGIWSFVVPSGFAAVALALRLDADPNLLDKVERSPLYWAIHSNDPAAMQALVEAGSDVSLGKFGTEGNILHEAASTGNIAIISYLLKVAPKEFLFETDVLGRTPALEARQCGHLGCAETMDKAQT